MTRIISGNPAVDEDRTLSRWFRDWALLADRHIPIIGTGSPEGVVKAVLYQEYIDSTGSAGSIKYIKMAAEVGGDRTKGWELV